MIGTCVASTFWVSCFMLCEHWCTSICLNTCFQFCGLYLTVELLGRVLYLAFWGTTKLFWTVTAFYSYEKYMRVSISPYPVFFFNPHLRICLLILFYFFKDFISFPGWCGSLDWVPVCEPKGRQFNSQSGHMPGLQASSPVGCAQEATTHWCFSPSLSPSVPFSKK